MMMVRKLYWQQFPAARFLIAMLFGAALYPYISLPPTLLYGMAGIMISIMCFSLHRLLLLWQFSYLGIAFLLGHLCFQTHDTSFRPSYELPLGEPTHLYLKVKKASYDSLKARWKVYGMSLSGSLTQEIPVYGWVHTKKDLSSSCHLIGKGRFFAPDTDHPLDGFDFGRFLQYKGIRYTFSLKETDILHITDTPDKKHLLARWRDKSIAFLETHCPQPARGIYLAVLLGETKSLHSDVRSQFAALGMAHILAVSGMHVGMLIGLIELIFSLCFHKMKRPIWVLCVFVIFCSWLYVAICEFAPSASRAALMANLYYLSRAMRLPSSGLHSLVVSAIILFFINPYLIFDLGAQLSYAAMIGVFLLYPPILQSMRSWFPFPEQIRSIFAISTAAQIALSPILLYYFGSIPLMYWLFCVPASYFAFFVFVSGWLSLLFASVTEIAADVIHFFSLLIQKMMYILKQAATELTLDWEIPFFPFSYALISGLLISCIISLAYLDQLKSVRRALFVMSGTLCLWLLLHFHFRHSHDIQPLTHYSKKATIYKFGPAALLVGDSSIVSEERIRASYPLDTIIYFPTDYYSTSTKQGGTVSPQITLHQ